MLFYLDNWQSVGPDTPQARRAKNGRGLNENYGRELLELHTLGVDGGYTQKDVTEVGAMLYRVDASISRSAAALSFSIDACTTTGEKIVLGVTIPAGGGIEDGEKVLDIVARHPSTAHFISRKLAQRFVADNPPDSLVNRMAQTFQKTDGDLRAVMQDDAGFEGILERGRVPVEDEIARSKWWPAPSARSMAMSISRSHWSNQVAQLGQPLYRKQEPTGYSNSSQEWLNSAGLLARMNFAVQLAAGKVPGVKVENADATRSWGSPEFQKSVSTYCSYDFPSHFSSRFRVWPWSAWARRRFG